MPRRMLTDRFCMNAKAQAGDVQTDYFDEPTRGLALRVICGAAPIVDLSLQWAGKRARMTIGTYPATSLGTARTRADEASGHLKLVRTHDHVEENQKPLKAICEEYIRRDGANLRSKGLRKAALERLVYPRLGDRPIKSDSPNRHRGYSIRSKMSAAQ